MTIDDYIKYSKIYDLILKLTSKLKKFMNYLLAIFNNQFKNEDQMMTKKFVQELLTIAMQETKDMSEEVVHQYQCRFNVLDKPLIHICEVLTCAMNNMEVEIKAMPNHSKIPTSPLYELLIQTFMEKDKNSFKSAINKNNSLTAKDVKNFSFF